LLDGLCSFDVGFFLFADILLKRLLFLLHVLHAVLVILVLLDLGILSIIIDVHVGLLLLIL
jgi:hypothetical protein